MGGGIGMGNTCKPLAVSFQCMTKSITIKKKKKKEVLYFVRLIPSYSIFFSFGYKFYFYLNVNFYLIFYKTN